jgi:UDP-4-amino-4-deoxy-L-arabinose formyltransferase/UDP-glucuronic acid dehydrogenase (UDP-4-keto-hexauronic acid decarboxylating)
MCQDQEFDEDYSTFVQGPTRMQRWIYSCCKQMLERVIWAYGKEHKLNFTLFRPFNWIGPRLDSLESAHERNSRVVTQLILDLVEGKPVLLVDGGRQKRCFTDLSDGIECLLRIIEDKNKVCNGEIFNIGNPGNEVTIKKLAQMLIEKFEQHPLRGRFAAPGGLTNIKGQSFYGKGYQDIPHRKPCMHKARRLLGWRPAVKLATSLEKTLDYFLRQAVEKKV